MYKTIILKYVQNCNILKYVQDCNILKYVQDCNILKYVQDCNILKYVGLRLPQEPGSGKTQFMSFF